MWISVEERLPEEEGMYLVYNPKALEYDKIEVIFFGDGEFWPNIPTGSKVSHWMPLPEPPEDE